MELKRAPTPRLVAAAIALLAAGAALPAATAEAQRSHRGERGDHYDTPRNSTRGTVCIGRTTHEFWFDGSPTHCLLAAFRECGYDAWIKDGCIYVRYHGHRPRFSIRAPGYSFSVTYGRGCVVISPQCLAPPPVTAVRFEVRGSWGGLDVCPPPRFRGHHGPRFGWNWGHPPRYRPHDSWQRRRGCR